jgi:hypothetical protein
MTLLTLLSQQGSAPPVVADTRQGGPGWNLEFVPDPDRKRRERRRADEIELRAQLEEAILGVARAPETEMPAVKRAKAIIAPFREGTKVDTSAILDQIRITRRIIALHEQMLAERKAWETEEEEEAMLLLAL